VQDLRRIQVFIIDDQLHRHSMSVRVQERISHFDNIKVESGQIYTRAGPVEIGQHRLEQ